MWDDPLFYAARMTELRERMRKLSDEQVRAIRRRHVPRDPANSVYAMAREFEVHLNTIFKIISRNRKGRGCWDDVEAAE